MGLSGRGFLQSFLFEQNPLSLQPPAIAAQSTIPPHHTVTGNGNRKRVSGTDPGDRSCGFRFSNTRRNIRVAYGITGGDLLQGLPNAPLKSCALYVQRKAKATAMRVF
jgi:hypothetical protein